MKYIIELEPIKGTNLWRAKGCNTLVFDQRGIDNILTPYEEKANDRYYFVDVNVEDLRDGDIIRFKADEFDDLYIFKGFSKSGYVNAIDMENGEYESLSRNVPYLKRIDRWDILF